MSMHRVLKHLAVGAALASSLATAGGTSLAASPSIAWLKAHHPAMRQVLRYGSRGHWVMTLQADLRLSGYKQVGPVDGIFGPKTRAALEAFQRRHQFRPTGVTSPVVWQEVLAGFGLVPAVAHHPAARAAKRMPAGWHGGAILPARFPTGVKPVPEPSLAGPSAGLEGGFTPAAKVIDGRPVLRAYHMVSTAYGPSLADNYPYGAVDASGQPLENGMVAVDLRVIPLGSVVYIAGYHDNLLPSAGFLGKATDTGGAIKGDRLDIFINAPPAAISDFGVQNVTVYVLGQ